MDNETTEQDAVREEAYSNGNSRPIVKKKGILIIGVVVALVVVGALIFAGAQKSMPGDALYELKVNVLEGTKEAPSGEAGAVYFMERMERRLSELKVLHTRAKISPRAGAAVAREIAGLGDGFSDIMNTEGEFTADRRLSLANDFAALAIAQERIVEGDGRFGESGEAIEDVRSNAVALFKEQVEVFAGSTESAALQAHVAGTFKELSDLITAAAPSGSTRIALEAMLVRVAKALQKSDAVRTLELIGDANRMVQVERYLTGVEFKDEEGADAGQTGSSTAPSAMATST